jgi:high-affinity iron transporter
MQSGSILLREGIEAMLVIAALAAFLRRAGASAELKSIYLGAGLAILASLMAAVVFDVFLGGAHDDRLEAVVMLLVAVLMFYMSGWLFLRQDPRAWNAALQLSAQRAMSSGGLALARPDRIPRGIPQRRRDRPVPARARQIERWLE